MPCLVKPWRRCYIAALCPPPPNIQHVEISPQPPYSNGTTKRNTYVPADAVSTIISIIVVSTIAIIMASLIGGYFL